MNLNLSLNMQAYVTQDDALMTTLTVREAVCYSAFLQLPDTMSKSDKQERAEATIMEMGLQDAIDTRIGGWHVKGLSGGQKRRVSICIEILTSPKLLFLDEPTSGLDSAASYHVMNRIIKVAQQDKRTIIASIHQPSGEVFELFHNLCLLSSGRMIYFGSVSTANEDIEQGFGGTISADEAINILAESYKLSEAHQQVQIRVNDIFHEGGFPSFVEDMKIFTRERLNGHYGVVAFVVGNTFSSIPYLFLVSIVPGAIAYYLVGLQKGVDHFIYFTLLLFGCMMLVESLMMVIASVVPNFLLGIIAGAGIQGVMILNGGFFRLPRDLPKPFWKYPVFYIAFHKYANQGFYKNEFEGSTS
ncbi:ABC transporter G family member 11 [Sesamum angolense]|uniref:ABC transporter G family member 11 n=1 Tax=Sesamum angolense TaxID=2727404 RepID=A0AAE2C798_9LAMI|nr:ABC transporter G family member 11 [Sesamum angolense]